MDKRKDTTTANEKMWDARAKNYDKYFWFTHWDEKKLVSVLKLNDKFSLLDLACAPVGHYAISINKRRGQASYTVSIFLRT